MRITIKLKLAMAFGVVIVLSAAAATLGITNLGALNDEINAMVQGPAQRTRLVLQINADVLAAVKTEKNLILEETDEGMARYDAELLKLREEMRGRREKLLSLATEEGRLKIVAFTAAWDKYLAVQDKVRELTRLNTDVRARHLSFKEGRAAYDQALEPLLKLAERLSLEPASTERLQAGVLVERLRTGFVEVLMDQRSVIVAETREDMDRLGRRLDATLSEIRHQGESLRRLLGPEDAALLDTFVKRLDAWLAIHGRVLALGRENSNKRAFELSTGQGRQLLEQAQVQLTELVALNQHQMIQAEKDTDLQYERARLLLISVLAGALVIAVGAAFWIAFTLSRGLGRAVALANAVTLGDLGQEVAVNSNDEVKDLVDALNRMTTNLRATAGIAGTIAAGDLSVQVKRLSDKDTLGIALEGMVTNLRATAEVAQTIAAGDLSVQVKRLSDKDTLGIALEGMVTNLRATVQIAETIAAGDLSVQIKRLSDKDTLGIALDNMTANLRTTAGIADAIAAGDLSVQARRLSDKDILGIALETMLDRLRVIVAEATSAADNVSSGSQELSASAEELSQGATEQAASAEEASASMEQMAANIKQNATNASQTEKIARQSSKDAQISGEAVNKAVQAMQTIAQKILIVQEIAR